MELDDRVKAILDAAERALAALAASAASERDYSRASELLAIAQRVANAPHPTHFEKASTQSSKSVDQGVAVHTISSPVDNRVTRLHVKAGPGAGFPKFNRDGDTLIKIGWSKTDAAPYEHRSPRKILDKLVSRIAEVAVGHRLFTTDELLPLYDDDASELPSYQCYLCLAWLVASGLIDRHGRQGYTVKESANFVRSVRLAWNALPTR